METTCTSPPSEVTQQPFLLARHDFHTLFEALQRRGYTIVGPTVRDEAIVYDELRSDADLPIGWTDEQDPGRYRLHRRNDSAAFGYAVGPHSWKKFLFPPARRLWSAERGQDGVAYQADSSTTPKLAFLGVRACELNAIAIQDRVFLGAYRDPAYASRRREAFLIAVNCSTPAHTCFCASMNAGPEARTGFDLVLTELLDESRHQFLIAAGTAAGAEVLAELPVQPATTNDKQAAAEVLSSTARGMGRHLETRGLKEALYAGYEHPRWEEVAQRCLTCANCTMVCPTCFCSSVEDVTDLTGTRAERWRKWDSCFTMDFSTVAGGTVRASARSRYRQWLTHKLATWHDQFGTSGCVGCGRCITWCPVGIDITEEARALCEIADSKSTPPPSHGH
jgi:ferredoxin